VRGDQDDATPGTARALEDLASTGSKVQSHRLVRLQERDGVAEERAELGRLAVEIFGRRDGA
jgi:hypothetical protein